MADEQATNLPVLFRVGDRPDYHSAGIPWAMMAAHEVQAECNHSQTLQRLHDRGGLVWSEALAVLEDRKWKAAPDAKQIVLAMVERWKSAQSERIEKGAIVLWHRFAPDSRLDWMDETHQAEYRDAASAVMREVLS